MVTIPILHAYASSMPITTSQSKGMAAGAPPDARERARLRIVQLVMLTYLLLIFEGSLRKYLLPSYGHLLFFVRDPFVIWIYWLAARHGWFPKHQPLLMWGVGFAVASLFWMALQSVGVASGIVQWPLLATYGWRNYFLYIPLPFVIGEAFQTQDLRRLIRLTLLLAVPIAVLVTLQFRSAPDAPINVGFGGLEEQFHGLGIDGDHTRPMGTFTSDVGQRQFVVSAFAMMLALWLLPASRRFVKRWQLVTATAAILSCLAVGGSRGSVVGCGVVMLVALASTHLLRGRGSPARGLLLPLALAAIAIILYPIVFPDGYAAFSGRWKIAAEVEHNDFGLLSRALFGFIDFFNFLSDTPLAGFGLGLAGNASAVMGVKIPGFALWAETDWARHIVDIGPMLGLAFIAYRIALFTWLLRSCLSGVRQSGDALPILLFGYVGVELLYGQITGHGTINGYAWLFCGLCLVASKAAQEVAATAPAAHGPAPLLQPRFSNLMR
jgi:hypothetical protein